MNERSDIPLEPSKMTLGRFVGSFGSVYEHSPWIAERAHAAGLTAIHDNAEQLAAAMAAVVDAASHDDQLRLLRAHPDLAGRLALAGDMTDASISEQSSAGLDACTPEEIERFRDLNEAYTGTFGFPFILAVRGHRRQEILQAFADRLDNAPDAEFREALRQVNRIASLRIEERFRTARD